MRSTSLTVAFLSNVLLGSICPMQFAWAAPIDEGSSMARMSMERNACPMTQAAEFADADATSISCGDGHCLKVQTPNIGTTISKRIDIKEAAAPGMILGAADLSLAHQLHQHRVGGPPLLLALSTVVLRL